MKRVAPLCLAALMATGCAAQALTTAPPTTPPATAPTAPNPVQAPPAAATPVLPAALLGSWQPISKALEGPGPLTLTAQTLSWAPCGRVARAFKAEATGNAVLLTPEGPGACRLDGTPVTHLRAQPHASRRCDMELSVYESAAQLAKQERLAWGVYTRQGCSAN